MSKLRSKCCGVEINFVFYSYDTYRNEKKEFPYCIKCHRPCELEEKEEESK